MNPRHYIYFEGGWNGHRRKVFVVVGPRAFSAEYMYFIAEFGAANRYYFEGLGETVRRQWEFDKLEAEYGRTFGLAKTLATALTNGQTVNNVEGLCELIVRHKVRRAVEQVASLSARSRKRRLAYVAAIVSREGRRNR